MHERTVRARTATGIVEGFTRDGVHRWRSIPYARAPVGSLRFRAPQPAQPWPGVRHCHTFANCAPQQRRYTVMGIGRYQTRSEDCLTLNVVTPEEPATQPLPVMVFIHGGGYILGSSATPIYDGAALARRGCVYVSVNYRLGALGCLDLSSLSTPQITLDSNVYLRDLVLALRWVHDNIAEFGGDPGNVTIFGESAGAHITATLLAVPAAKGLFARAISESPAAGMVRSREVAAEFAARFANLIGARTQDAANALMQASPAQLVEAQHHLIRQGMRKRLGAFPIGPVFGDDYLPMDPVEAMRSGRVHAVPLIVGTNAEEGRLFTRFLGMLPTNEPMAGEIRQFVSITVPLIRGALSFVVVISIIHAFQAFDLVYVLTGANGGPETATYVLGIMLFQHAFSFLEFGYASALAWVMFAILLVLTVLQLRITHRRSWEASRGLG